MGKHVYIQVSKNCDEGIEMFCFMFIDGIGDISSHKSTLKKIKFIPDNFSDGIRDISPEKLS
jgi:hypothetical protein